MIHALLRAVLLVCFVYCQSLLPLRILFIVKTFPAPSQTFILNQMTGILDRGHDITIFSFNKCSFKGCHPDIIAYKLYDKVVYKDLASAIAKHDIIFCQFGYLGIKTIRQIQKKPYLKGKKVITCLRGADITAKFAANKEKYKSLFQKGDLFLPVCDYFRKLLITKCGCPANKIVVHYSAIDLERFPFREKKVTQNGTINCLSVCRLVEKKGVKYVVDAIARLVKKYPNIRYYIVGDGPEKAALEEQIKTLGMKDFIFLTGWKSVSEVVSLLNKAHIFLLTSITGSDGNEEGIPNALKEAMAVGVPVIATWHAGNSELIQDGVSGFLVRQKNSQEIENRIDYLLTHPEVWHDMVIAARETIENRFNRTSNSVLLEDIFLKLINKKQK